MPTCASRALLAGLLAVHAPASEPDEGPNVLLIVADDQGFADLSCAKLAGDVETPRLDELASGGVRFTHAYAASPICNVSRAALMTGCYPQRFGAFWYGGKGLHDERFTTLAELFRDAGYATGYVGKFHYGGGGAHRPGNRSFPLERGFDEFYGFSGGRKHYLVHEAAAEDEFLRSKREHGRQGQSLQKGPMWDGAEPRDVEGLSTELFGARARSFLTEHADDPFFLVLAFNAVHNFTHQLPPEYMREHGLEGYRDWDPAVEEYVDWYRAGRRPNNPEGRAHYLGQLHFLDREVGRVLDYLNLLKLRSNTIVVYVGDNGGSTPIYADNGPLRGSKYTLYEGGLRVPLIVDMPVGHASVGNIGVCDEIVSVMDLYPTLCMAAGIAIPEHVDGLDLGALLSDPGPKVPLEDLDFESAFSPKREEEHDWLAWDTGHETALRRGRWKLKTASSDRHAQHEMVELELGTFLYDLEADPGETTDVSAEHPEVLAELLALHAAWRAGLDR